MMKAKKNSIELMQWIVSALTPAMNLHRVQSRIFEKQGYVKTRLCHLFEVNTPIDV